MNLRGAGGGSSWRTACTGGGSGAGAGGHTSAMELICEATLKSVHHINPLMNDRAKLEIVNRIKLSMRARGMVIINIGTRMVNQIASKTANQLLALRHAAGQNAKEKAFNTLAHKLKLALKRMLDSELCGLGLTLEHRKVTFLQQTGQEAGSHRDDTRMALVVQVNPAMKLKFVGVASFGTAYSDSRTIQQNHDMKTASDNGKLLEIDAVCVIDGAPKGTGTLLTAYVAATELRRKKKGGAKYDGIDTILAFTGSVNNRQNPFKNVAKRVGMKEIKFELGVYDQVGEKLFGCTTTQFFNHLKKEMNASLPDQSEIEGLCAFQSGSGIPYCT